MAARGLAGSPSDERSRARNAQNTALGIENAGNSAEEQLYNTQRSREAYQHQADLSIFGAQVGDAQREQARQDAEQGAFWNSLNEYIPAIIGGLGGQGGAGTTYGVDSPIPGPPRGYNPGEQPPLPRA